MQKIANEEMAAAWNGISGRAWVDEQQLLDRTYAPIEKLLVDEVAATGARAVLDIGCGAGATTLAVARSLGTRGRATGIDLSEPLVAVARARARARRRRRHNSSVPTRRPMPSSPRTSTWSFRASA